MNQIGEHRPQLKIRHDHWVPFCVLTGLPTRSLADEIISKCVTIHKQPLGYYRLPLSTVNGAFPGWKISEEIKTCTRALKSALEEQPELKVTLHWERLEFQEIVKETNDAWPESVKHEKLELLRNRYPIVEGFDNKTRTDIMVEPEKPKPIPTSYKDLMKKPKRWKARNIIPAEGQIHRYGSKFGKSFPILKKTALTSRYRKQEE